MARRGFAHTAVVVGWRWSRGKRRTPPAAAEDARRSRSRGRAEELPRRPPRRWSPTKQCGRCECGRASRRSDPPQRCWWVRRARSRQCPTRQRIPPVQLGQRGSTHRTAVSSRLMSRRRGRQRRRQLPRQLLTSAEASLARRLVTQLAPTLATSTEDHHRGRELPEEPLARAERQLCS